MDLKELVREHSRLVEALKTDSHLDDRLEGIIQSGELASYVKRLAAKQTLEQKVRTMLVKK